jgi:hypothetical protein
VGLKPAPDAATVAAVAALLRRPPTGPILLVVAARTRQASGALLSAVAYATRSGQADRLDLEPLTVSDSRRLLDDRCSDEQADALSARPGTPHAPLPVPARWRQS